MSITKELTVLIFDYGNYAFVAEKFAKSYKRVLYYCPYAEAFPKYNKYMIGTGMDNVQKVESFWPYYDEIDLWFFTDLYQGEFQDWLRNNGKAVFGAGTGEKFELLRDMAKRIQKDLGMDLNEYDVIYGFDNLQKHLETNEDKYIKTNTLRGSMETWHHENIKLSQPILDELNHTLGVFKNNQIFISETPINNAIEYGGDNFCMEGKYPAKTMFGLEIKDSAYICTFIDYEKLPPPLKNANRLLSDSFANYGYRGWFSSEMRSFTKDKGVLTDFTCRLAEPPTSLAIEMLEDYPLYVWQVAIGEVPNVKSRYKYGAQIVIKSDWARTDPQAIYFPDQYKDYVKIKNLVVQDGIHYFVPTIGVEMEEIGAVVNFDNTLKGAIEGCKKIGKEIKGHEIKVNCESLNDAEKEIQRLKDIGVNVF